MAKETLSHSEVDALLAELESKMSRLRTLFEQYFMGIERRPPTTLRKDVVRLMRRLENVYIKQTAQKFRYRSLVQRFNSYKAYWNRVSRQIEEGTYARDRARADRRQKRRDVQDAQPENGAFEVDLDMDVDLRAIEEEFDQWANGAAAEPLQPAPMVQIDLQTDQGNTAPPVQDDPDGRKAKIAQLKKRMGQRGRPGGASALPTSGANMDDLRRMKEEKDRILRERSAQNAAQSRPTPAAPTPPRPQANNPSDQRARQVYEKLVEAKRRCNESTKGLTFDSVSQSVAKQRAKLKEKKGATNVDFQVVIKNGKAFLKPVTK